MRAWLCLISALAALSPGTALAQEEWTAVIPADVRQAPTWRFRQSGALFLATEGDFDGDGQPDRARLIKNQTAGRYAVLVSLSGAGGTVRVAEGPLAQMASMGLTMVGAGLYSTSCANGAADASACERRNLTLDNDAISLFQFEGAGRYLYWTGSGFEEVWIRD